MPIRRFSKTLFSDVSDYRTFKAKGVSINASGGTISIFGPYTIHTFTVTGSTNFSLNKTANIEYLIVAGGGGSGGTQNSISNGGNAGQVLSGSTTLNSGSTSISVGAAGTAGPGWSTTSFAQPGGNSSIQNLGTATGGASGANTICCPGQSSGGTGGSGISASGTQFTSGIASSITGVSITYGSTFANGPLNVAPAARPANSGDGGQTVWSQGSLRGGDGGSGIVIVRYITDQYV